MNRTLTVLALTAGLAFPAAADETERSQPPDSIQTLKSTPDDLPEGIRNFNGMLVGRLADKDVERGTFVVLVDAVPRVWRNSRAENPKSIVGKTVKIDGVFGKFLDVLIVMRNGETIEFECKHDGDGLTFPGELLRKVAPYKPEDYPTLPEGFRGFRGAVAAEVMKKDPETFELIVRVDDVLDTWKESDAKQPESIEGKQLMLAGFWNRHEAYHDLKVGDRIEVGVQHVGRQSDHLTVAEFVRKAKADSDRSGVMGAQRGFRGMLVGRLTEKDVESGTFTIIVDAVPRVWNNNQSSNPKSLIGQSVRAQDVPSRLLDALVVARIGDTIEFGALHDGDSRMRVGEVLAKVSPVMPGDYPELPDAFRGFRGKLVGEVVKKDEHLLELKVKIHEVKKAFQGSRAETAESIVGKQVVLVGFWRRKETFHGIRVGDKIAFGVEHTQQLSDHLSVIESVEKVEYP